jgi:hypothetical protein
MHVSSGNLIAFPACVCEMRTCSSRITVVASAPVATPLTVLKTQAELALRDIAASHQASIRLVDGADGGLKVTVWFPTT